MAWQDAFLSCFGSGFLSGITLPVWWKVLRENRFAVDPPYWAKAVVITLGSFPNTLYDWGETLVYGRKVRNTKVPPPVFILGIWRSGTTHLHYLFAQDDRFAYPNNYQVMYPRTFLITERMSARLVGAFLSGKQPLDNVSRTIHTPQEDEFALCSLTGETFTMNWMFPRREEHYRRYLTLRAASAAEVAAWKSALSGLVRKLSFKYGKPLVLKSPSHTCRIKLLLELFPDAKFVHIHRNPYAVFQSIQHMHRVSSPFFALQRPPAVGLEETVLQQYEEVYGAFLEERELIPRGQFHEVGFEELEADPIGQMRGIYEGLGLPDFAYVEPRLRRYLESVAGYQKNSFRALPGPLQERIAQRWRRCFDEWGYAA